MPCYAWKCVPAAISSDVDISEVPGCHLLWQMISRWGSQKSLQGLVSHELIVHLSDFNLFLTFISKIHKPDNFESYSSLKLSFTSILGLCSNFVECESFVKSNPPDILALCEINLDDSIDSGNFSVRGYLPLIQKDSITHCCKVILMMPDLTVINMIMTLLGN